MGTAASAQRHTGFFSAKQKRQYVVPARAAVDGRTAQVCWHLPNGGTVVAICDFEPESIRWPEAWGSPALRLHEGLKILVLSDDGGERAFGHPVGQPVDGGYFLKHCAEVIDAAASVANDDRRPFPKLDSDLGDSRITVTSTHRKLPDTLSTHRTPSQDASRLYNALSSASSVPQAPGDMFHKHVPPPRRARPGETESSFCPSTAAPSLPMSRTGMSMSSSAQSWETHQLPASTSCRVQREMQTPGATALSVDPMTRTGMSMASVQSWETSQPLASTSPVQREQPALPLAVPRQSGTSLHAPSNSFSASAKLIDAPPQRQEQARKLNHSAHVEHVRGAASIQSSRAGAVVVPELSESGLVAAQELRLDLEQDEGILWLAEHAANVELPDDWVQFLDDEGLVAYYQAKTKRVTRQHPMQERYKRYAMRLRSIRQRQADGNQPLRPASKVRPHMAVILNEVLNRCNRELPPLTPELLERTAILLGIDVAVDFALTMKLKSAMELFAEDQYDISVATGLKADVDSLLKMLREQQVKHEVLEKPEGVIMCSEFEDRAAAVKCEQCMDMFSLEGFAKTHVSGKRKNHTTLKVEQLACSIYAHELATCEVDNTYFCDRGYEEAATRNPQLRYKHRIILGGLRCSEYSDRVAEVLCEDCCDLFSWEGFYELHGHGHRQKHVPLHLDSKGLLYRGGRPLPPEEASRLMSRARLAREGGAWLAFRDDQLNTYWYHLSDKVVTHENPYFGRSDDCPRGR